MLAITFHCLYHLTFRMWQWSLIVKCKAPWSGLVLIMPLSEHTRPHSYVVLVYVWTLSTLLDSEQQEERWRKDPPTIHSFANKISSSATTAHWVATTGLIEYASKELWATSLDGLQHEWIWIKIYLQCFVNCKILLEEIRCKPWI